MDKQQKKVEAFMDALDAYIFSPCPEDRDALQNALSDLVHQREAPAENGTQHAPEKRKYTRRHKVEHQDGNDGGEAAEAGGSDSTEQSGQEQGQTEVADDRFAFITRQTYRP